MHLSHDAHTEYQLLNRRIVSLANKEAYCVISVQGFTITDTYRVSKKTAVVTQQT